MNFDPGSFREFIDAAEIGIVMVDDQRHIVLWNEWMCQRSGIPVDWVLGRGLVEVFPDLHGSQVQAVVEDCLRDGRHSVLTSSMHKHLLPLLHEGRIPGRGEQMQQIVVVKAVLTQGGEKRFCLVQVFDVTTMAHREALLRQQAKTMEDLAENYRLAELQIRAIVNNTADAIITFGSDGLISTYNTAAETIFGYDTYEAVGKPITILIPDLDLTRLPDSAKRHEVVGRYKAERSFPLELSLSSMELGGKTMMIAIGHDITERKLTAQRISHLAHHDSLTALPNRELFQERLRQSLATNKRSGGRLALMFLDLDKFKDVNDTLGHYIGDLLLKAVAKRLTRCVRETDTVARLGGDEFAIILTHLTDPGDVTKVAEAIISAISDPFGLEEHEVLTSTSIGITISPDDSSDPEQLLKNADLAMFRSKSEGRNNYHFYVAEMNAEIQARKRIEHDLRLALGTSQLRMHFQPLIELSTKTIVGCEALIRWLHPSRGWVGPAEFIPVAERSDIIQTLGRWVLHRSCQQAQIWAREGLPPLKVAVNLSPAQFKQRGLVEVLSSILDQTGMPPSQLQLEITEGIAMQNVEQTLDVLRQIRAMGVVISIDDFGTGYSSLNYLKRFPVDKLKIDRSFVVDIGKHPDNEAVVQAIVDLGHSLGTRVNVEGVETQEQLDFLVKMGVDEAQGYLFSPALPADEFSALVRKSLSSS